MNKVQISSTSYATDSTPTSSNLSITLTHSLHIKSPYNGYYQDSNNINIWNDLNDKFIYVIYCYNYITEGTEKGDWYLLSAKELMKLVSSKNTISSSLASVGGTFLDGLYWSSTEYNAMNAWSMRTDSHWGYHNKATTNFVKCVIGY